VNYLVGTIEINDPKLLVVQCGHAWIQQLKDIVRTPNEAVAPDRLVAGSTPPELKGRSNRGSLSQSHSTHTLKSEHVGRSETLKLPPILLEQGSSQIYRRILSGSRPQNEREALR
jgi:hypothetical protein